MFSSSLRFAKFCCCHTVLKDGNNFLPVLSIILDWFVKFGTREFHKVTLSCCQFTENREVKDKIHVEGRTQLHQSFQISNLISKTNRRKSCPRKFVMWLRFVKTGAVQYIYSLNKCVKEIVFLHYHWVPNLYEKHHKKFSQNGGACLWVSCISAHGRP